MPEAAKKSKNAPSIMALERKYKSCSVGVRGYFDQFPDLISKFKLDVCLAYMFFRTEMAQNTILYCGVVKLHRADQAVARKAIEAQYLTRQSFLELFANVFSAPLPDAIAKTIKSAEKTRDRVLHGKLVEPSEIREALHDVLDYASLMNFHLEKVAGFKPFGDLRGFKGRTASLEKQTSRWLLKGLGFSLH
ncbi:MAG: hypothetical protein RBT76_15335 [candidate division Zixibacteria bacterium]|jgi:hypothetical protein|nr:hypothetical protein [candidate division Zixibacteria bacterium]